MNTTDNRTGNKNRYRKNWRKKHSDVWQLQKKRYYRQFEENAVNSREQYTDEEIDLIMAHNIPDRELSLMIGRSVEAIQVIRSKIRNGYRK